MTCPICFGRVEDGDMPSHYVRHHEGSPIDTRRERRAARLARNRSHKAR